MNKLFVAATIMALLFVGVVASESDAESGYGTVRFYIGDEFITSTDTDYCAEVAERIDTYREGYVFLGWTDDPSTNRVVDITNLLPEDVNLYAVYEPVMEPEFDWIRAGIIIGVCLMILVCMVIFSRYLS